MSRPTKRARNTLHDSWIECQTLIKIPCMKTATVIDTAAAAGGDASAPDADATHDNDTWINGTILETQLASQVTKEIFLERFRKEVIDKFDNFSLSKKRKTASSSNEMNSEDLRAELRRTILKERILVGLSVCSKSLRSESNSVELDLIVLSSDYQPTHFAVHIPILARQRNIPILLLPNASTEMGNLLGIKCAGVIAFATAKKMADKSKVGCEETEINASVDSFVDFVKRKIE